MSQSTTSGGVRLRCARKRNGASVPAAPTLRRSVARMSIDRPRAEATVLRTGSSGSGSLIRRSSAFTSANSSTLMVAKSFFCSTSRAENENAASSAVSSRGASSRGRGGGSIAWASRAGSSAVSPARPCTFGSSAASIFSSSRGLRQ